MSLARPPRRVLLVNPKMCSERSMRLPISLLALGAVLEERYEYHILDGNIDPDLAGTVLRALADEPETLVGVSVMPGPQVATAIEVSLAVREAYPQVPILWGGYFPTMYPDAAINAPYVDYVARGQGEDLLLELLAALPDAGPPPGLLDSATDSTAIEGIAGLTWKAGGAVRHNADRHFVSPDAYPPYPYEKAGDVARYLRPSFMGQRTGVHQAAIGCRYNCEFCGVVSMFNGKTILQGAERLRAAAGELKERWGATAMQYYDNNFFDTEAASEPLLDALGEVQLPWWCYARADTLANFSTATWKKIEASRLSMAYIGAEAGSDAVLKAMKKGSKVEHTFEVARRLWEHKVIPEFSFVLGGPTDPEGEIENTLSFIKKIKAIHPTCEVVLYFYSPTPRREKATAANKATGLRLPVMDEYGPEGPPLPITPEEWTEPKWINYVCHQDAPWLSPKLRRRVQDFATVLGCRFPTVQDYSTPRWGKAMLRTLARWRYETGRYGNPWELRLARKIIPLREPQRESL
jgi:radical SAM superfamily enzyme YgiQ (UPF0313 family)